MVRAAGLLHDHRDIILDMIGEGSEKARALALAEELGLTNIHFSGWVDKHDLPARVAEADICLGVFGTSEQSTRTIQNKIYEGLAMRKAVISGDSPTVSKALVHGQHACLIPRNDPVALAAAILHLKDNANLRAQLAAEGYAHFQAHFTPDVLGRQTRAILEMVAARHWRK